MNRWALGCDQAEYWRKGAPLSIGKFKMALVFSENYRSLSERRAAVKGAAIGDERPEARP